MNAADQSGRTALVAALFDHKADVVRLLLDSAASVNVRQSPYHPTRGGCDAHSEVNISFASFTCAVRRSS